MVSTAFPPAVPPFSIHDDLWHDCWVAATAVRGKKELLKVDECIRERVARLLESYGPNSSLPLTLRIYGTLIKGFCVLNNYRVRALQGDCERLVFSFTEQPSQQDASAAASGTKRKHVDAMTLDLNIKKVREAEAFDWSQAPLEEGAFLQLAPGVDGAAGASFQSLPIVVSQSGLLDEAFPALDVPTARPEDFASEAAVQQAIQAASCGGRPEDVQVQVAEAAEAEGWELALPALSARSGADEAWAEALAALAARGRLARGRPLQLLGTGVVHGFDEDTMLPPAVAEAWRRDDAEISERHLEPGARAAVFELEVPDRLGLLRPLLVDARFAAGRPQALPWLVDQDAAMPAAPVELSGAGEDLVSIVCGGAQPPVAAGVRSQRSQEAVHDEKALRVGDLLRQHAAANPDRQGFSFEELLPPRAVDRPAAALAFHALLTLATAGELLVEQAAPFAPLLISVS